MVRATSGSAPPASPDAASPDAPSPEAAPPDDAMADAASLTTGDVARDEHLRSADFFDVEQWPTLTVTGSGLRARGGRHLLDAVLTIRDVSHPVTFEVAAANLDPGTGAPADAGSAGVSAAVPGAGGSS